MEEHIHLHADNCSGQKKNKSVLGYLMWRCATSLSDQIELSLMRVGHARCAVDQDGYFRLIKQKWRTSENDTLQGIKKAVDESCAPNFAVMHNWPWMEWDLWLLRKHLPVRGILKFQHFLFSKDDLLNVQCRHAPESEPTMIIILKHGVESPTDPSILLRVLPPAGLLPQRWQYLGKEMAPYTVKAEVFGMLKFRDFKKSAFQ